MCFTTRSNALSGVHARKRFQSVNGLVKKMPALLTSTSTDRKRDSAVSTTLAAVAGSQAFDLVYVMTKGGPANSTSVIIIYIYQQAFQYSAFGYAAAWQGWLLERRLLLVLDGAGDAATVRALLPAAAKAVPAGTGPVGG